MPFNDPVAIGALLDAEPDRFAAVICEPLQRALPPEPGFLDAVRVACDRTGTVLIFDEVVTGFRLAPGGAQERYGVGARPHHARQGAGRRHAARRAGRPARPDGAPGDAERRRHAELPLRHVQRLPGGVECAHATLDLLIEGGGIAELERITQATVEVLRRCFADAGEPVWFAAAGGLFQPYFTDRPVRNAADVRASDLARLKRYTAAAPPGRGLQAAEQGVRRAGPLR